MVTFDFFPSKCSFESFREISFFLTSAKTLPADAYALISISYLGQEVFSESIKLDEGQKRVFLPAPLNRSHIEGRGMGFLATCDVIMKGSVVKTLYTAFDCCVPWTAHPRYGYLCDFSPGRKDIPATIEELCKFHINGLQFYDWQFRHEQLVSSQPVYQDILGRELSLETIKSLIEAAHQVGMACMPYLAIYGASLAYWKDHADTALYNTAGRPITFHDFLGLMDPSPKSDWTTHLSAECKKMLEQFPFDGLHIDQYGEPRIAYNADGKVVDLPASFVSFINNEKKENPKKTVVFNAVKNWPIEALSTSSKDFMYIEIWPPAIHYQDLLEIIRNAQQLSSNKPVVLALYIPAKRTANVRLSSALIFAAGAARIELGENGRYLSDPYFPKNQPIAPALYKSLRRYYDFAVAYHEWLKPSSESGEKNKITAPDEVLCLLNIAGNRKIIHLINFTQIPQNRWDKRHAAPRALADFQIQMPVKGEVTHVQYASPDENTPCLESAHFTREGTAINITIPSLKYWTMISIEMEKY